MNALIIVFTDLDGTFLDHNSYTYEAALPTLDFIRNEKIPLIFTSSKTAIEIEELCTETKLFHPYIAENGGLLSVPENYFSAFNTSQQRYQKILIGTSRAKIDAVLQNLSENYSFTAFSEMNNDELVKATGLKPQQANAANTRDCSEPIQWLDREERLESFSNELAVFNLRLIRGGRFHHIMGKHDKASTMSRLIQQFAQHRNKKIISIALGDSPNDYEMLNTADYGILIPNPNAPKQCLEDVKNCKSKNLDKPHNLLYASYSGPKGWNEKLQELFRDLIE